MSYFSDNSKEIYKKRDEENSNILLKFEKDINEISIKENKNIEYRTGISPSFFRCLFDYRHIDISSLIEMAVCMGYKLEINFIKDEDK